MRGHSDGNTFGTCRYQFREIRMLGKDQGQGARPECRGKPLNQITLLRRRKSDNSFQPSHLGKMNDQGIGQRTSLGLEDARHGKRLEGIRRQPVDGLGRHPRHSTPTQQFVAFLHSLGTGQNARAHVGSGPGSHPLSGAKLLGRVETACGGRLGLGCPELAKTRGQSFVEQGQL